MEGTLMPRRRVIRPSEGSWPLDPGTFPPLPPIALPVLAVPLPHPIPCVIDFGTVVVLAGAPGVGRRTLMAEWCVRWQQRRTICGYQTNPPTGVYYLSADRGGHSTRKLFDAQGFTSFTYY